MFGSHLLSSPPYDEQLMDGNDVAYYYRPGRLRRCCLPIFSSPFTSSRFIRIPICPLKCPGQNLRRLVLIYSPGRYLGLGFREGKKAMMMADDEDDDE